MRKASKVAISSGRLSCALGIHLSDAKLLTITSRISRVALRDPFSHHGMGRFGERERAESLTKDGSDAGTLRELNRLHHPDAQAENQSSHCSSFCSSALL